MHACMGSVALNAWRVDSLLLREPWRKSNTQTYRALLGKSTIDSYFRIPGHLSQFTVHVQSKHQHRRITSPFTLTSQIPSTRPRSGKTETAPQPIVKPAASSSRGGKKTQNPPSRLLSAAGATTAAAAAPAILPTAAVTILASPLSLYLAPTPVLPSRGRMEPHRFSLSALSPHVAI